MLGPLLLLASTCSFPDDLVCEYMEATDDHSPVTTTQQAQAKAYFGKTLFDSQAARWQFTYNRRGTICGYVNSKNRFGGYVGWTPFYFSASGLDGVIADEDEELTAWRLRCFGLFRGREP